MTVNIFVIFSYIVKFYIYYYLLCHYTSTILLVLCYLTNTHKLESFACILEITKRNYKRKLKMHIYI